MTLTQIRIAKVHSKRSSQSLRIAGWNEGAGQSIDHCVYASRNARGYYWTSHRGCLEWYIGESLTISGKTQDVHRTIIWGSIIHLAGKVDAIIGAEQATYFWGNWVLGLERTDN